MSRSDRKSASSRLPRRFAPRLLSLETRELLSTLTVTTTADDGPGSLRAQVAAAASGDTINFAKALNGRTIAITSGLVPDVGKDLTIQGPGAGKLTISGGGTSGILGFYQSQDPGAPIIHVSVSGLTLADGKNAFDGGAIAGFGASLAVTDCVFSGNTAGPNPGGAIGLFSVGGVDVAPAMTLNLTRDRFLNNSAGSGGAVLSFGADVTVVNSSFSGDQATFAGGGCLNVNAGSLTVSGSSFSGEQNGAIAYYKGAAQGVDYALNVSHSTFTGNSTTGSGGAIASNGDTVITASDFERNSSINDNFAQGGAVYVYSGVDATIDGSRFVGNTAQGGFNSTGGAVFLEPGQADSITNTAFLNNQVSGNSPFGGALDVFSAFSDFSTAPMLTLSGDLFSGNQAVGVASGFGGNAEGGAVESLQYPGSFSISNSKFIGNQAIGAANTTGVGATTHGGAISLSGSQFTSGLRPLSITNTSFVDNSARGGDGGLYGGSAEGGAVVGLDGFTSLTISGATFSGNSAVSGSGGSSFSQGGAVEDFNFFTPLAVTGTSFLGNSAVGGNAVAAGRFGGSADSGALSGFGTITDSTFAGNSSRGGNGGPGADGGEGNDGAIGWSGTITGTRFLGNSATGGDGGAAVGSGVGGRGGAAFGGALSTSNLAVSSSSFVGDVAKGGRGGSAGASGTGGMGGFAFGGGIAFTPSVDSGQALTVTGSLFALDLALGGSGATPGLGLGGGIDVFSTGGTVSLKKTKFLLNYASTEGNDVDNPYGP